MTSKFITGNYNYFEDVVFLGNISKYNGAFERSSQLLKGQENIYFFIISSVILSF